MTKQKGEEGPKPPLVNPAGAVVIPQSATPSPLSISAPAAVPEKKLAS